MCITVDVWELQFEMTQGTWIYGSNFYFNRYLRSFYIYFFAEKIWNWGSPKRGGQLFFVASFRHTHFDSFSHFLEKLETCFRSFCWYFVKHNRTRFFQFFPGESKFHLSEYLSNRKIRLWTSMQNWTIETLMTKFFSFDQFCHFFWS